MHAHRRADSTPLPAIWGRFSCWGPGLVAEGTYESDVFDAKNFSKWGRAEVRGSGSFDLFARSGNVDNPDRNWSQWKKVDLQKELPMDAPSARFIQWKAVLHSRDGAPTIDSVTLNYLPKNVAPEVDDVTVMVGSRVPSGAHSEPGNSASYEAPVPTVRDRRSIVVKWKAHDDNDDTLEYGVYYRGDGEASWKLLREGVDERFVNLESDRFPDGGYVIKVIATDAPSHSPQEALTGEATSPRFEVDNTPPRIESLSAQVEGDQLHLTFRAVDNFSPIKRAEYSIDADDWQIAEPVGQISDYKIENYDFKAPIPAMGTTEPAGAPEAVRGHRSAPSPAVAGEHTDHRPRVRPLREHGDQQDRGEGANFDSMIPSQRQAQRSLVIQSVPHRPGFAIMTKRTVRLVSASSRTLSITDRKHGTSVGLAAITA